jgi:iron(III) transport system ATP-binding protein
MAIDTLEHVTRHEEGGAPGGSALRLENVSLHYGAVRALDEVSFDVASGSILCLLGSSGSGKSSALRVIAGLERPTAGRITIQDDLVAGDGRHVEPERRHVGMVFQDYALFPHLTIKANVAFGLRRADRREAERTAMGLLRDVGLADRADCYPHVLSGGERQRVALARALAPRPRILLMDEPFSSLDPRLRDQVREHTIDLLRRTGTTTVLVTHDPVEAMRVADRIGVLSQGRLVQFGTAADIYQRPCSRQMACVFGHVNSVQGSVENGALLTPLGAFPVPAGTLPGPAVVCVRPQHLRLETGGAGVRAIVTGVTCVGDVTEVHLRIDDLRLVARVPDRAAFAIGDDPRVCVDPSQLFVFPQSQPQTCAFAVV